MLDLSHYNTVITFCMKNSIFFEVILQSS